MAATEVTGWILAGGEGRRMGGVNKGLQSYKGQPLVQWVIQALGPQTDSLHINANRDQADYARHLAHGQVWPDAHDIDGALGPIAGILTGLRRPMTPWLMVAACDTPKLPADLVARLHRHALDHEADIAVPLTRDPLGETWHHWTCALIHARSLASLEAAVAGGERRVGQWIQTRHWIGVSFADPAAFINVNTLETLHGQA
jgi:molybdopterin-guanine dinucleotide biosynthesis protein A